MGITVLPAPNFPSVGESLARLGPDLGRILFPNREDNRQKEERMQALREAFAINPGAMSRTAEFARSNPGFKEQLTELVGLDFTGMIVDTPADLDETLSVAAMEQALELRKTDPEAFRNLAAEATGIGVAPEDLITSKKRERFLELWEEIQRDPTSVDKLDAVDRGVLNAFGINIPAPARVTAPSTVASVNAIRSRLLSEEIRRPDLASTALIEAWIANPNAPEVREITRVLGAAPPVEPTEADIVAARSVFRDVIKVDSSITLEEVENHILSPDPASKVTAALNQIRTTGEAEATRRVERQRAVDLGIAGTRIRSVINATRGRNPISQDQAKSQILDQINTSINPMLKQMGDDLGIPGLHAEIPDVKRELWGIDWLRSDVDIPGITVFDRAGKEFDFNQIMNLGTIPGRTNSSILSPNAQTALDRINSDPDREDALLDLRQTAPALYAELVRAGEIIP